MTNVHITNGIDIASVVLYSFWLFFAGLILYLRREDRREGYPLEHENTGDYEPQGGLFFTAEPKTFILPHGKGIVTAPNRVDEPLRKGMERSTPWPGSPYEPTGNPLVDGVGPAAFAERSRFPDQTIEGHDKIVPLRIAEGFAINAKDPDPRGMKIFGSDDYIGGIVTDVWVDRSERVIRYLEVKVVDSERSVLVPMAMVRVSRGNNHVTTDSIAGGQFIDAPVLENPLRVTRYEEERVIGYFGGGYLYSSPTRAEPII
jgi:photosynthetic reaction center H subunit